LVKKIYQICQKRGLTWSLPTIIDKTTSP
jgi:hypothetical protein